MNTIIAVFAIFIVGTQAGHLHAPTVLAAAPVAVATPVLTHTYPTYAVHSPVAAHIQSTYAAPALYAAAAPTFLAAPAPLIAKAHLSGPHVYTSAQAHHFTAPRYGYALRK